MNIISTKEEETVLRFLKSHGCCLRCRLRFMGCRTTQCNFSEFAARADHTDVSDNISSEQETPCVVCLGILQDKIQETVIAKIADKVEQNDYDCGTFTCALTIPVSIRLREHILYAYMSKETNIDESIVSVLRTKLQNVKDVWKLFTIPKLEQAIRKRADLSMPSPFLVEVFLEHDDDKTIFNELMDKHKGCSNKQRRSKHNDNKFSRKNIETLLSEMTDEQLRQRFALSQIASRTFVRVDTVLCSHSSIFIGGRYNKLSRELSQTPWFVNGEKKVETSVQDLLCNPIAEAVKAESIKFLSSGREDVDVRNVYDGRPFAAELLNPRMTNITGELLTCLATTINQSTKQVKITSGLKILSKFDLKKLKEGENVKTKFYRALCVCRGVSSDSLPRLENLNKLKDVKIVQRTPVRVLHRRPLSPRTRVVYEMRARWAKRHELEELLHTAAESADTFFVLDVKTQAGTYVKEFVHGDFGRTKPSLRNFLNTEVDIIALDVTGINLKWP
ncbi:hypothetical protein DMN91_009426 [Ooceraea biroi]|uniref:tRNA pseudouridine(55) synthase n=1 Tax=Ooceraea biroi TaxID=2015173 RepID=A0A3L8DGS4_OOCBI|nr:putative tRNA pseudouridine synthase Pus10 [Ooceraea biroi]RLU19068.1 hypothetical protein DMN91_009426 [Ooceraea biroi]